MCLFDFTYKNKVPDYFVFRVDSTSYSLIDNHFYSEMVDERSLSSKGKKNGLNLIDTLNEENEDEASSPWSKKKDVETTEKDLMIERNCHYCST